MIIEKDEILANTQEDGEDEIIAEIRSQQAAANDLTLQEKMQDKFADIGLVQMLVANMSSIEIGKQLYFLQKN